MGFLQTYKRLDNLCKDMNGIGVTGYINDMEQIADGRYYVSGWKDDYYKFKHYRYIRNQIVHENYAEEDNLCLPEDSVWLNEFYQRILERKDPLAVFNKACTSFPTAAHVKAKPTPSSGVSSFHSQARPTHAERKPTPPENRPGHSRRNVYFLVLVLAVIAAILAIYISKYLLSGG